MANKKLILIIAIFLLNSCEKKPDKKPLFIEFLISEQRQSTLNIDVPLIISAQHINLPLSNAVNNFIMEKKKKNQITNKQINDLKEAYWSSRYTRLETDLNSFNELVHFLTIDYKNFNQEKTSYGSIILVGNRNYYLSDKYFSDFLLRLKNDLKAHNCNDNVFNHIYKKLQ